MPVDQGAVNLDVYRLCVLIAAKVFFANSVLLGVPYRVGGACVAIIRSGTCIVRVTAGII